MATLIRSYAIADQLDEDRNIIIAESRAPNSIILIVEDDNGRHPYVITREDWEALTSITADNSRWSWDSKMEDK